MDETKLRTIAQLQEFLAATPEVTFTLAAGVGDAERYEHISRVLKRFDYPRLPRAERGVILGPTCAAQVATAALRSPAWWPAGKRTVWQLYP